MVTKVKDVVKDEGWTIATYAIYNEAMRTADKAFQDERDRRYTEVNVEKEKALKIKETADLTALELARESQVYKDERNDSMREQSFKDNGMYVTRDDLAHIVQGINDNIKQLSDYVTGQKGSLKGSTITKANLVQAILITATILTILGFVFEKIYK